MEETKIVIDIGTQYPIEITTGKLAKLAKITSP